MFEKRTDVFNDREVVFVLDQQVHMARRQTCHDVTGPEHIPNVVVEIVVCEWRREVGLIVEDETYKTSATRPVNPPHLEGSSAWPLWKTLWWSIRNAQHLVSNREAYIHT